jgi:hypothetical protein
MGDRNEDNRTVGSKDKPEERSVAGIEPKKSALRDETKLPTGMRKADPQDSQFLDPFQSSQDFAMANQHRGEVYSGRASIGLDDLERGGITWDPFPVREMVRDPETGKIATVVYTQEQLDSLRQERKEIIDYLNDKIEELNSRVLTRTGQENLKKYINKERNLAGTFFERDSSADYEYTPKDFSKKVKAYLEDLIELNEEYIELCKELLPEDPSQLGSIQFAQNKLKRNLEQLIEILTESVENEPDSEQVEAWKKSIAKYQAKLQQLDEGVGVGVGLKAGGGGGSAAEEADFGGRKKSKSRTIKRKLAKKSKKNRKGKSKGKTSKKRSKRSRRR